MNEKNNPITNFFGEFTYENVLKQCGQEMADNFMKSNPYQVLTDKCLKICENYPVNIEEWDQLNEDEKIKLIDELNL